MAARGSGWGLLNRIEMLEEQLANERSKSVAKRVRRGFHMQPVDIDAVKVEAVKARQLMKEMQWKS
jgi:hypothetical protein